jgi:hypothetical protein
MKPAEVFIVSVVIILIVVSGAAACLVQWISDSRDEYLGRRRK